MSDETARSSQDQNSSPVVETFELTRRFGSFMAVANVSLAVNSGEICGRKRNSTRNDHRRFLPKAAAALSMLAAVIALLPPASAIAASKRFDCSLTELETKVGPSSDFKPENRSISVVVDEETKAITVYQDGEQQVLNHVTITQTALNGYNDGLSLGIDASSSGIVLQTYKPDSTMAEFGTCRQKAEQAPPHS